MEREARPSTKREIAVLILLAFALLLFLSLVSYHRGDATMFSSSSGSAKVKNLIGLAGASISWVLILFFGLSAYLLPFYLFIATYLTATRKLGNQSIGLLISYLTVQIASAGLATFYVKLSSNTADATSGGLLGRQVTELLLKYFNNIGTILLLFIILAIGFLLLGNFSFVSAVKRLLGFLGKRKRVFVKPKIDEESESFKITSLTDNQSLNRRRRGKQKTKEKTTKLEQLVLPATISASLDDSFKLPSTELLDDYPQEEKKISKQEMGKNAKILEEKLADFGVFGHVTEVCPGPVVTMYEYRPAPGIKISRIVSLADDLAMALRALSVRVIAPLPEKAAIGIEIPNKNRELVSLKELLTTPEFANSKKPLSFVLGKDIMGRTVMADLARMPHLLIAGATGTGKSVCINAILASLLFKYHPEDLKLLLIDPKRIELNCYEGIPHLLHPVVTDVKMATNVLRWAVAEMEHRYELLAELGVRNLDNYNIAVTNLGKQSGEGTVQRERLPYILLIIDELSDLMMVASKEVEELVIRLAQMARAAGIHLVLATQRPSVDVITGLIKANIPSRISFQVSSRTDSRTILDVNGAEMLLGDGDMLFLPPGTAKLQRLHGAFISDKEVKRLTDFLRKQCTPKYDDAIAQFSKPEEKHDEVGDVDEKYEEALEIVRQTRQASISMLQRRLRVGYNRAARMIEMMEKEGIVGPSDGSKPREVYLPPR